MQILLSSQTRYPQELNIVISSEVIDFLPLTEKEEIKALYNICLDTFRSCIVTKHDMPKITK